jgi:hypothetical protein
LFIYIGKYLLLGEDAEENWDSIAQFSVKDADAFVKYELFLGSEIRLFLFLFCIGNILLTFMCLHLSFLVSIIRPFYYQVLYFFTFTSSLPLTHTFFLLIKLGQIRAILQPLLDSPPPDITQGKITEKMQTISGLTNLIKVGYENRYVMKYNILITQC